MGATCLVHWRDANGQQSLTLLSDRLLKQFHATPIGRWTINWKVFRDTSLVSKSGTGKMMHLVHVQGGATARGVPAGSQAASLSAGGPASGSGIPGGGANSAGGASGAGPLPVGIMPPGPGGMAMAMNPGGLASGVVGGGIGGPGKPGLGLLPSVAGGTGPSGTGVVGTGAPGGPGAGQAGADNAIAWCLIDDGAVGVTSTSSAAPSVVSTPASSAGTETTAAVQPPKRKAVLVEVEKDIEALIAKLKTLWVHRQHAQVEGHIFDLGDFIVRAGNIMVASTSYKGMLIEIEYLPQTSSAIASNAILEEFVRLISPPGVNLCSPQMLDYPYEQVGLDPKKWSMLHSGFQYMTLFRRQHIL
ncbi:hypothetical protein EC968_007578 [Mortierella alpina]|nr:hypothetical protein EC968_007578 [Mortierella alpina]